MTSPNSDDEEKLKANKQKEKDGKIPYRHRSIIDEIDNKIDTLNKTRNNRMGMSNRLKGYSHWWKFIFFILNIEAVIFVLLSVTNTIKVIEIGDWEMEFNLISGVFTIYVILLQYYVNGLNYDERSLRVHYHQLDIEDCIIDLKHLHIERNTKQPNLTEEEFIEQEGKVLIEKYDQIITKYQLVLKNNENHDPLDYKRIKYNKYKKQLKKYEEAQEANLSKDEIENLKPTRLKFKDWLSSKDFTLDQVLIIVNVAVAVAMLLMIISGGF